MKYISIALIGMISFFPSIFAMGENPLSKINMFSKNKKETSSTQSSTQSVESPVFKQPVEQVGQIAYSSDTQEPIELTEEMIEGLENYDTLLARKQFDKALEQLEALPLEALNEKQVKEKATLQIYAQIYIDLAENERQFGKDESLAEDVMRSIKRLQREAKQYILQDKQNLSRDILIQSLYLDRKNFVSKQLLERCLGLPLGSYKVENIEKKYWEDSLIQLRSGYPTQSVDSLHVLAQFDTENPMIFERMGSAYYMSGQVKKAIESWKRALYLDPNNKALNAFIENAEKEVERQKMLTKAFLNSKRQKKAEVTSSEPMTVLRVVQDSNAAYSYAQEVRQQMVGINVVVEELDNGKWAVKIPMPKEEAL